MVLPVIAQLSRYCVCSSCTDVNAAAAELTVSTGKHNRQMLNTVVCDLVCIPDNCLHYISQSISQSINPDYFIVA